jgi:hypothetical protein
MGLLDEAAALTREILEDVDGGFARALTLRDPTGTEAQVKGISADIGAAIDLNTGQAVAARQAHVSISMLTLAEAGIGIPKGEQDSGKLPWLVTFTDATGKAWTFKVLDVMPDRTLGLVKCTLGLWQG